MYVHAYIHTYLVTCACIHTYFLIIYLICIYIRHNIYIHIHTYINAYIHTYIICAYICIHVNCICIHIYIIYICIHMYIYTCTSESFVLARVCCEGFTSMPRRLFVLVRAYQELNILLGAANSKCALPWATRYIPDDWGLQHDCPKAWLLDSYLFQSMRK